MFWVQSPAWEKKKKKKKKKKKERVKEKVALTLDF
jgi:hypothetical protein